MSGSTQSVTLIASSRTWELALSASPPDTKRSALNKSHRPRASEVLNQNFWCPSLVSDGATFSKVLILVILFPFSMEVLQWRILLVCNQIWNLLRYLAEKMKRFHLISPISVSISANFSSLLLRNYFNEKFSHWECPFFSTESSLLWGENKLLEEHRIRSEQFDLAVGSTLLTLHHQWWFAICHTHSDSQVLVRITVRQIPTASGGLF